MMGLNSTRKTVLVILVVVTVVMLRVSRQRTVVAPTDYTGLVDNDSISTVTETSRRILSESGTAVQSTRSRQKTVDVAYATQSYTVMDRLVQQYQQQIQTIRDKLWQKDIPLTNKSGKWVLLDGYDNQLFEKAENYPDIFPVYMTNSMESTRTMLPATKYYNYVGTKETCHKMDVNSYNGPRLLNKTCVNSIKRVHMPVLLDRTQLSVGIPFKMSDGLDLPVGPTKKDVLLHFGFIVKDALILKHGIVFSNGSVLQPQRCKPHIKTVVPANHTFPEYSEVFSLTQQVGRMFYHLVSEDLPRIAPYLDFLLRNKNIKIHSNQKPFLIDMLEYLGISSDRLVSGDIRAQIVYMPAGTACGRPAVFTTQYLSSLFIRRLPEKVLHSKQDTIILIKRSSKIRQFLFHKDILEMLQTVADERGLRAVEYRDDPTPSLNSTMEIFYRALMVIAPHGAGLSNLVFSRPGVVVLESYCMVNLCFRNLVANTGHIHHGYMNEDFKCLNAKPNNFRKDVEKHLDVLEQQNQI